MASFVAWPFWQWLITKEVTRALQEQVQALANQDQQLKAAFDVAMLDGVLTEAEANIIVEGADEPAVPAE